MDRQAYDRETRISRAFREVVPHYTIEAAAGTRSAAGKAVFHVRGKPGGAKAGSDYTVSLARDWAAEPGCTCPDSARRASVGGYCKHVIAVLLTHEEFRCQLLELFLGD